MSQSWRERSRPTRLEKRYEFANYDELRDFLDSAADLSERNGFYPDMGFGRNYVNITIHADEGGTKISPNQYEFVKQLDEISDGKALPQA